MLRKRLQARIFPASIFLLCLLIGFQAGASLGKSALAKESQPVAPLPGHDNPNGSTSKTTLPNGQRNILLVSVDDLESSSPRLDGVWLLSYVPNNTRLTFLPVYPSLAKIEGSQNNDLFENFKLKSSQDRREIGASFLDALGSQVPWWSSYIVLDAVSLSSLDDANRFGSKMRMDESTTVHNFPHSWEDPQAALASQAALFQEMCWQASRSGGNLGLGKIVERLPEHILSDLDNDLLQAEIKSLREHMSTFSCEFPTLTVPGTIR